MNTKNIIVTLLVTGFIALSCDKNKDVAKLEGDKQKASYAIGNNMGNSLSQNMSQIEASLPLKDSINKQEIANGMKEFLATMSGKSTSYFQGVQMAIEIAKFEKGIDSTGVFDNDMIVQGMLDKLYKKKNLPLKEEEMQKIIEGYIKPIQEKGQAKIQKRMTARTDIKKKENLEKSNKFFASNKTASGVKTTASGLQYKVNKEGDKTKFPSDTDLVKVIYTGKTIDGREFDSSKGQAVDIPLGQVIPGWKEGLKMMSVGSKYTFYIPASIGYGENGNQGIGPNEGLIFEVELVSFGAAPKAPQGAANGQPQMTPEQMQAMQQAMQQQAGGK